MSAFVPDWLVVAVGYFLALLMSLHIVMQRREPTATLAWVLAIVTLPYVGLVLYVLIGRRRLDRQLRRRQQRAIQLEPALESDVARLEPATQRSLPLDAEQAPQDQLLINLSSRMGCRPPTVGNRVQLLADANAAYVAMERAIAGARNHIHFQFYIFQSDETGRRFRDLLVRKAADGVAVRVLTDGVGSFKIEQFMQPLIAAGGAWAEFLPVGRISRRWHLNLRNHRKLVIVDGHTSFTGGVNIGDEYTGRKRRIGAWRDTHLQLEGPASGHLQEIFAEDWHFATGERPAANWFQPVAPRGVARVHIVASGPDTETHPIQRIFFAAVNGARSRIYLTTPYFVPDQAMGVALETAALRGVDVRLLLPSRSDALLVLQAGRSYYEQLLRAGVRIFEYQAGVLHAKTLLVDRSWATVGSANMDVRSFQLNFEVNAAVYGSHLADQLAELFHQDLKLASEISLTDLANKRWPQRMGESLARILSPLL